MNSRYSLPGGKLQVHRAHTGINVHTPGPASYRRNGSRYAELDPAALASGKRNLSSSNSTSFSGGAGNRHNCAIEPVQLANSARVLPGLINGHYTANRGSGKKISEGH
jgi:hypothetical protein